MVTIDGYPMRIGNQLFKIAAGYSLALRNNDEFLMPEWSYSKFFGYMKPYTGQIIENYYWQNSFDYQEIPYKDNLCLQVPGEGGLGFLQSEKYFSDCKKPINELLFPRCEKDFSYKNLNTCCIHVRRGDYVQLSPKLFPLIPSSYYECCMTALKEKFKDIKFIVFSDDIEWCKTVFSNCIFSEGNNDIEDFFWMCQCNHFIIANSSFSWWAAWLGRHPDKIVYVPATWFGPDNSRFNAKDIRPHEWINMAVYP